MCKAFDKRINNWFQQQETLDLVRALADDMGLDFNYSDPSNSIEATVSKCFPNLIVSRRGNPADNGGTWVHPDLAIQLAQWCSPQVGILTCGLHH